MTTQTHRENFLILISVEFHSQIMAGGQGAVNVSLLDRLGIYLPFLIDFLLFYFFYLFLFFFSLISLQEYRILTNKVIKKSKLNMYRIQRL